MFIEIAKSNKKISTESRTYVFDKISVSKYRVDFEYKSYNHNNSIQSKSHKTKGYFLGDVNDISWELPQLLEAIFLNKRKYETIKIYAKNSNGKR